MSRAFGAQRRPDRTKRLIESGRRDLCVLGAAFLEPERGTVADDQARIRGCRPGRPPVHDRSSESGAGCDLPERLDATLAAAHHRGPREPQEVGDVAKGPSDAGSLIGGEAALNAGDAPGLATGGGMHGWGLL